MTKASGIMALIGGAMAAIGVFMYWVDVGVIQITGWQIWDMLGKYDEFNFYMVPMIVLVLGVLAILLAGISLGGKTGGGSRLFFIIIGIALIALPILFLMDVTGGYLGTDLMEILGWGFYMSLIGGLLVLIAAALPNAK